ncbi:MAG TPA: hypothetical protein DDY78_20295 [Planctomycetales bacterium]|jgi:hypothetical protein|nr:hypothetical protein [Planctomycetales bacterium]
MVKLCPACSKANPATAIYCYYDGRHLSLEGQEGPLLVGTLPLPMPFYFPDGQSCANFNQLALACDARWDEAKGLLADGTWHSYFCTIGRLDLAVAAKQAGKEQNIDLGLSQLLEVIPTDPNVLRRPQLSLLSTEENLGALTPGTDRRFDLMISNRGLLVLRGMATTNCEWLSLGEGAGAALKMFQTRGIYTLPVRVLGNRLRAGRKPLQGEIIVDTNGGAITVPVRADIPVRPFPSGTPANNVLAGAKSPREIALKAKASPLGAAALFEQGAVKAWYASNGWTYPVQGTQASGKGAVQQYFEALGLSKPPHLENDTERLDCHGKVGQRLTKHVTISTKESRLVYAQAWSNQHWIKAGPNKSEGNKVTIPLQIEVPPRPGETFHADVTIQGNGLQKFVVPVTLAVSAARSVVAAQVEAPARKAPLGWIFAGAASLLLVVAVGVGAFVRSRRHDNPAIPPTVPIPNPAAPAPKNEPWWDGVPNTNLAASVSALKQIAPQDQTIFDGIAAKDEMERGDAYEKLAAELPKLLGNPKAKEALGQLLVDCCVYEPSKRCLEQLAQALTSQIPAEGAAFQPEAKGDELERGLWAIQVFFGALTHKAIRPDSVQTLAYKLGRVVGLALEVKASPDKLKEQTEELLSKRYYSNTLPTAKKSIEHALEMRELLIKKFPQYLTPAIQAPVDVELLAAGLSKGNKAWPEFEPILKSCLDRADSTIDKKIIDLYKKADQAVARKTMETLFANRWKQVWDPKSTPDENVQAIRRHLDDVVASAQITPRARLDKLQKLTDKALSSVKAEQKKETVLLQDTVRLAHASTMACTLFHKEAGVERLVRFDNLVKQVPDVDQTDEKNPPDKTANPKPPAGKGKVVDGKIDKGTLTTRSNPDPSQAGFVCKEHLYALKAGKPYTFYLRTGYFFNVHLRLEDPKGTSCAEQNDFGIIGRKLLFSYTPQADGDYAVIVSAPSPGKLGKYDVKVVDGYDVGDFPLFGPGAFGPRMVPGAPQPAPKTNEKKDKQLNKDDLAKLDSKISTDRVAAFENLADSALNDLTPLQAQKIAKYLLAIEIEDEFEKVKLKLESFSECRSLLLALADLIGDDNIPIAEKRTEAIVGGVLAQQLGLAGDKEWRTACRTTLLQRALDLTSSVMVGADQAADILCALYKEQGRAFGIEDPDFFELTRPTQVLESVIKRVAAKAAEQNPAAEDKDYLEQVGRYLQAARFLAENDENDLEHMVLLQRAWIKVLVIYLQEKTPAQAKAMVRIQQALDDKDHRSSGVLDQLRAGEEKVLRIWAVADNLNLK